MTKSCQICGFITKMYEVLILQKFGFCETLDL